MSAGSRVPAGRRRGRSRWGSGSSRVRLGRRGAGAPGSHLIASPSARRRRADHTACNVQLIACTVQRVVRCIVVPLSPVRSPVTTPRHAAGAVRACRPLGRRARPVRAGAPVRAAGPRAQGAGREERQRRPGGARAALPARPARARCARARSPNSCTPTPRRSAGTWPRSSSAARPAGGRRVRRPGQPAGRHRRRPRRPRAAFRREREATSPR